MARRLGGRLVDGFPAIVVAVWTLTFAAGGTSLPIHHENRWQIAAGIVAVANFLSAANPYRLNLRFMSGVLTLSWLAVWTGYLASAWIRDDSELASRLSVWGIVQFVVLAVFVAWSYGRQPIRMATKLLSDHER